MTRHKTGTTASQPISFNALVFIEISFVQIKSHRRPWSPLAKLPFLATRAIEVADTVATLLLLGSVVDLGQGKHRLAARAGLARDEFVVLGRALIEFERDQVSGNDDRTAARSQDCLGSVSRCEFIYERPI